jgi:hypothetical protein
MAPLSNPRIDVPRARDMVPAMTSILRALSLLCLTACTQFPSVDAASVPALKRPSLLPTRDLAVDQIAPLSEDPLAARAAALRTRADTLRSR